MFAADAEQVSQSEFRMERLFAACPLVRSVRRVTLTSRLTRACYETFSANAHII